MKNLIFVILSAVMLSSCTKDHENTAAIFGSGVRTAIIDSLGNDLLDPENPNAFDINDIRVFYIIDGVAEVYHEGHLDAPHGYRHFKPEDFSSQTYSLAIFLNSTETEKRPMTLVQWRHNDIDTITAEFRREPGFKVITKVFFNGEKKWEGNVLESELFFEIIK